MNFIKRRPDEDEYSYTIRKYKWRDALMGVGLALGCILALVIISMLFGGFILWLAGYDAEAEMRMEKEHEKFAKNNVKVVSSADSFDFKRIKVVSIENHQYIIYDGTYSGSICHSASCPCLLQK